MVYGCFMTCNVFLAGNSEVSLELQCFTAELITYIVCECNAPECSDLKSTTNPWGHWTSLMYLLCDHIPVCVNYMSFQIID